jgi:hypothetical protein
MMGPTHMLKGEAAKRAKEILQRRGLWVEPGQVWEDRGVCITVESVSEQGDAIVRMPNGQRLPVPPSYFERATLVQ